MIYNYPINQLIRSLTEFFNDKTDKCGYPYISHCLVVAQYAYDLSKQYYCDQYMHEIAYIVGLCHDCYEDLNSEQIEQVNQLIKQYDCSSYDVITQWLELLTRRPNVSYKQYFNTLCTSKMATLVKAADSYHNSQSERYDHVVLNDVQYKRMIENCARYKSRHMRLIKLLDANKFDRE